MTVENCRKKSYVGSIFLPLILFTYFRVFRLRLVSDFQKIVLLFCHFYVELLPKFWNYLVEIISEKKKGLHLLVWFIGLDQKTVIFWSCRDKFIKQHIWYGRPWRLIKVVTGNHSFRSVYKNWFICKKKKAKHLYSYSWNVNEDKSNLFSPQKCSIYVKFWFK